MTYLSILEKLKILFDMILDFKIVLIFIGVLSILTFIYSIKKITGKKYMLLALVFLIITFTISIISNYKILSNTFDNFTTILFSNIYFPSIYVYIGILVITSITFITSILNSKQQKIYKVINSIAFIFNSILLIIILNIIAKNKIDIFSIASLYTNRSLVAILEISMGLFILWIITLIITYTTNYICRDKKQTIINNDLYIKNNSKLIKENKILFKDNNRIIKENKALLQNNNVLTEENKILSEDNNRIIKENKTLLQNNNVLVEENKILSEDNNRIIKENNTLLENNNKLVEENAVLLESNNKFLEEKNYITKEIVVESNDTSNDATVFNDILNGRIPVTYYDTSTVQNVEYNLTNPQQLYEEKYNIALEELKNEISFQDVIEDIIPSITETELQDTVIDNALTIEDVTKKEKERLSKERLVINTIALNNLIEEEINEVELSEDINNAIKEETTVKEIYTIQDYKQIIKMLNSLKNHSNTSNISVEDAISISLISNYSIDDCIKFKEILESNLN